METIQTRSLEELDQIIRREFPAEKFSTVMAILEELKSKSEKHRTSIKFNLVNLSRGSIEILRKQLKLANDFLDQPHQPIPKVTRQHVERVVRRDYPSEQFEHVMAILSEYPKKSWPPDFERVQLDVLKLANGNIDSIRKYFNEDYRDIISAAEYPSGNYERDWQQYLAWANAK